MLAALDIATPEEMEIICSAVWHHDSKADVDAPMDEILKDADVIGHSLTDPTRALKAHEKTRFEKLCVELGLSR